MPDMWSRDDIQTLVRDVIGETGYKDRNTEIAKRRDFLRGKKDSVIPNVNDEMGGGAGLSYHSPKTRLDALAYQAAILRIVPDIEFAAVSDAEDARDAAQMVKNSLRARYANYRLTSALNGAAFDMAGVHHGELAYHLNIDILPIVPQPEDGENPLDYAKRAKPILDEFKDAKRGDLFQVESVPCETVYDTPDGLGRILAAQVPLAQLQRAYAKKGAGGYARNGDGSGKAINITKDGAVSIGQFSGEDVDRSGQSSWAKTATLYIVSTADYCYHLILDASDSKNDNLIGCYKNYFGRPQFVPVWANITGDPHPLYAATPIVDGLFDIEPLMQLYMTGVADIAVRAMQTRKQLVKNPKAQGPSGAKIEVTELPGGFVLPPEDYEIKVLGDMVPAEAIQMLQLLMDRADRVGFPEILRNPQEFDATSGVDRTKAQDAVSAALDLYLENWGNGITTGFEMQLNAQRELGVPTTERILKPSKSIGGAPQPVQNLLTLEGDKIPDGYLSMHFDSTSLFTKAAQREQNLIMVEKGLMSDDELLRRDGVEDIERWYDDIDVSTMRKLARKDALADAVALRDELRGLLGGEAMTAANLEKLYAAAAGQQVNGNGAAPTTPFTNLEGSNPEPAAEMGATQGATSYAG